MSESCTDTYRVLTVWPGAVLVTDGLGIYHLDITHGAELVEGDIIEVEAPGDGWVRWRKLGRPH
jgi:hypothetical protein